MGRALIGVRQDAPAGRLVLATHNAHKLRELRAILDGRVPGLDPADIVGAGDLGAPEPVEDGLTFAENALLKARALAAFSGMPAVADDSGLCVDVLGGAPGIFSARWSGRHGDDAANLRLLLDQLADVAPEHRGARFTCAAALVTPDGFEHVETGHLVGRLTTTPRGGHGFGYDPILVPDGEDRTSAELTPEEKNAISHRGRAFRALAPVIAAVLAGDTPVH
jgi:XTP/dITP diphosphohydrolase